MVWFKLVRASEQAWLGVSLRACHELIRAIMGGALPRLVRPLGPAEKGLVAAMLASALSFLGAHQATLALMDGQPCWQGQRVLLAGAIRGGTEIDGRALFIGPLSWLVEGAGRAPMVTSTEDSVVEGVLVLARTVLPAPDLGSATPGDAVVFDGIPGLDPGGAWPVTLQVGRFQSCARLAPSGCLALEGSWQQREEGESAPQEHARWKPSEQTDTASGPAEVIAELGRINLRENELMALSRGEALTLGPRPLEPIALRVGGLLWATGELITLGEQLGVRIVRLPG
jgi:flagellar motor switch/type III secretory pathway protein FliN